jgi:putative exosortase-associated protein (TIGR04073 family)
MNIMKIALVALMIFSLTSLSYADTTNIAPASKESGVSNATPSRGAGVKLERGVKNILFGWTEIPKAIIQVTKDSKNPIWGLTGGTLKGAGKAFPRTISGAADVISFPIADYDKTPIKPDELKTQIN